MDTVRVKVTVRGRVQGVFYRASTRDEATRRGLSGWVRNRRDGSVELEAQGPKPAVDGLIDWCRQGPPDARVDAVDVAPVDPCPDDRSFSIRH